MTKEFTSRTYKKGDEDEIVELLKLSFPEWATREKPQEYWNWKYRDTPLGSSINVILSNEIVVGVGHEINLNIKVGSRILKSQYGDDYTTHPNFRRRGVYKSLVNRFYTEIGKQIEFEFSLSTNPIVNASYMTMIPPTRLKFAYSLKHLFRIKNISMHIDAKKINNKAIVKYGFRVFKSLNNTSNSKSIKPDVSNTTINEPHKFSEKYNDFWENIKDRHNFIIERSAKYLNWRYKDPRGGSYIIREARNGDKIFGYIVLQVREKEDYPEGYIVDISTTSEDPKLYNTLLEDACKYFDDLGLNAVNLHLVNGHPLYKYAKRYGFLDPHFISKTYIGGSLTKAFDKEREILESSKPNQLHFCYGDQY